MPNTTTPTYSSLFDQRGSAYDTAMRQYPDARVHEFGQVIKAAQLKPHMVVGDVPAGGSYLRGYLPDHCQWLGHEPCASFTNHSAKSTSDSRPLLPLPWQDAAVDVTISLAGVHHLEDKVPLFKEIHRVTKPGGRFILSDAQKGSNVALFLDGYIGANNSTGHHGIYLDASTETDLKNAGWTVQDVRVERYDWIFVDLEHMAMFCNALFDLRHSTITETTNAINKDLGVIELSDGKVGMNWSLLTIQSVRTEQAA